MKLAEQLKFPALLLITSASRLIPLPFPNVEPIMAASMPAAKKWGALGAAGFAVCAYVLKDVFQARAGLWTLYGAVAYALVALFAFTYLKPFAKPTRAGYVKTAVVGTLVFDLVTALVFGWQFGQTLTQTLIGQVPFTLYHLAGNMVLAFFLSPVIFKFLAPSTSELLETTTSPLSIFA